MTVAEMIKLTCSEAIEVWAFCDDSGEHSLIFYYNDFNTKEKDPEFPEEILSYEVTGLSSDVVENLSVLFFGIDGNMDMFEKYKENPNVDVQIW